MADTSSSGEGAMPTPEKPATGTAADSATLQKQSATTLEEALARIAELEHATKNATEERDRHRKRLKSYEDKEQQDRDAALSEVEKATKRATAAEETIKGLRAQLITARIESQAAKLNIIDPDIAAMAISGRLELGEDGMPTNIDKALNDLVKSKPYLVAAPKQEAPSETAVPETPAQPVRQQAPAIPAMNPGRSTIAPPGAEVPGQKVTFNDVFRRK